MTGKKISQTKLASYRIRDFFEAFFRFGPQKKGDPKQEVRCEFRNKGPFEGGEKGS